MSKPTRRQLATVIFDLYRRGYNRSKLSQAVAAYLIRENRTGELASLLRDLAALEQQSGRLEVVVSSATPLSDSVSAEIKRLMQRLYHTHTRVLLHKTVDATMLGGLLLETADKRLDLTIRSALQQLKRPITTS